MYHLAGTFEITDENREKLNQEVLEILYQTGIRKTCKMKAPSGSASAVSVHGEPPGLPLMAAGASCAAKSLKKLPETTVFVNSRMERFITATSMHHITLGHDIL